MQRGTRGSEGTRHWGREQVPNASHCHSALPGNECASPAVSGETDFLCWWGRVPTDSPRWGRKGKPSLQDTGGGWQQTGLLHTQVRDFTAILLTSSVFHCLSSLHRLKGREPYVPNCPQSKQSNFKATAFLPPFLFHTC